MTNSWPHPTWSLCWIMLCPRKIFFQRNLFLSISDFVGFFLAFPFLFFPFGFGGLDFHFHYIFFKGEGGNFTMSKHDLPMDSVSGRNCGVIGWGPSVSKSDGYLLTSFGFSVLIWGIFINYGVFKTMLNRIFSIRHKSAATFHSATSVIISLFSYLY